MSRKYMDFAPRRSGKNSERSITSSSGTLKAVRPSLRSSDEVTVRSLSYQSAPGATPKRRVRGGKGSPLIADPACPAQIRVKKSQEKSQFVTRTEEMGEVEDYWAGELGVIEDLETGVEEDMEKFSRRDDEIGLISSSAKQKDNRVGYKEGKSPFINTEKLEKRPLSAFRRGGKEPMPKKNEYNERKKIIEDNSNTPTMVVTGAGKGSSISLAIIIILVAILGAAVGFVVYLAFFQ